MPELTIDKGSLTDKRPGRQQLSAPGTYLSIRDAICAGTHGQESSANLPASR